MHFFEALPMVFWETRLRAAIRRHLLISDRAKSLEVSFHFQWLCLLCLPSFLDWFYIEPRLAATYTRLATMKMPPCIPVCRLPKSNLLSIPYLVLWQLWQA